VAGQLAALMQIALSSEQLCLSIGDADCFCV